MISEQDKKLILNGAYGITNNNRKVRYLGENTKHFIFAIEFNGNWNIEWFSKATLQSNHQTLIGLWQDKPEPFDLERALAGELIKYSGKPCYIYQSKVTGLFWVEAQDGSFVDSRTSFEAMSEQGMWKESEPEFKTVTLTLPCPVLQPEIGKTYYTPVITDVDGYDPDGKFADITEWVVDDDGGNVDWQSLHRLEEGLLFETKEDIQAWLDALKNNRR